MIESLRKINLKLIKQYENNPTKLKKQLIIFNFLKHNDCFFKISIEDSYNILKDLGISNYKETYIELISCNNFNNY